MENTTPQQPHNEPEQPKKKRFSIPKIGLGLLAFGTLFILAIIALVALCVPFVALILLVNMLFNKGKISFIKAPEKRIENEHTFGKIKIGF